MSASWIAERVSVRRPSACAAQRACSASTTSGWGPNNTFRFPRTGGTGEIYRRLAARLDGHACATRLELVGIDTERRDRYGSRTAAAEEYDALVSTMPARPARRRDRRLPRRTYVSAAATLEHNGVWVVGVGYERRARATTAPGSTSPTPRCRSTASRTSRSTRPRTSPAADTTRYSSYMTETSYSEHRPREPRRARAARRRRARRDGSRSPSGADRVGPHDRRRLRLSDPHAATATGAGGRPAVADGARHLLARPVRVVAVRDREHGPRREDGRRRRPTPVEGRPEELWARLSRRATPRLTRGSTRSCSGCSSSASASSRSRSPSCSSRRLPGGGSSSRGRSGCSSSPSPSGSLRACTSSPIGAASVVAALLASWRRSLSCSGAAGLGRVRPRSPARSLWLVGEVVFTAAFFVWALLRSFAPDVWQTEKPMDMALVNASNAADSFPPHDPWQSGDRRQLLLLRSLPRRVPRAAHGYRPGGRLQPRRRALLRARGLERCSASPRSLYEAARRDAVTHRALAGRSSGSTAAAFAAVARQHRRRHPATSTTRAGSATYDWWSPSRVIDGNGERVPVLQLPPRRPPRARAGDAVRARVARVRGPARRSTGRRGWPTAPRPRAAAELLLAALVLGSLYAMNSFDFPTACAIGLGALLLWALESPGRWRRASAWGCAWIARRRAPVPPVLALVLAARDARSGSSATTRASASFARDYAFIYGICRSGSCWRSSRDGSACRGATSRGAARCSSSCSSCSRRRDSAGLTVALAPRRRSPSTSTFASGSAEPAVPRALAARRGRARSRRERARSCTCATRSTARRASASTRSSRRATRPGSCSAVVARRRRLLERAVARPRLRVVWLVGLGASSHSRSSIRSSARTRAVGSLRERTRRSTACAGSSAPRLHDAAAIDWLRRSVDGAPTVARDGGSRLRSRRPRPRLDVHRPSRA